jgi:hypothetical protein
MARDTNDRAAGRRRRARILRPYEWTHADPQLDEWLRCQALDGEGWNRPDWAGGPRSR